MRKWTVSLLSHHPAATSIKTSLETSDLDAKVVASWPISYQPISKAFAVRLCAKHPLVGTRRTHLSVNQANMQKNYPWQIKTRISSYSNSWQAEAAATRSLPSPRATKSWPTRARRPPNCTTIIITTTFAAKKDLPGIVSELSYFALTPSSSPANSNLFRFDLKHSHYGLSIKVLLVEFITRICYFPNIVTPASNFLSI